MRNGVKLLFFGLLVILIGVFIFSRPSVFVSGDTTSAAGNASSTATASSGVAVQTLPSLSADLSAQDFVTSATTATEGPDVGAKTGLVADLLTGDHYLDMSSSARWPMASISKLMTAVIVEDNLSPDQRITITESMVAVDPTQKILHVGDTYTVANLLYVMLLPSNNVAAEAFAEFYGRTQFLAAMNAKAQLWGMTSTYYDDPSGLSAANQSSANDLLKLAQHIYTRTSNITVDNLSTGQPVIIKSINDFAGTPEFVGGKTGYTDQADGNLLSVFQYEGRPIFVVVLGINDGVRFDATQQLYDWFKKNFK